MIMLIAEHLSAPLVLISSLLKKYFINLLVAIYMWLKFYFCYIWKYLRQSLAMVDLPT